MVKNNESKQQSLKIFRLNAATSERKVVNFAN